MTELIRAIPDRPIQWPYTLPQLAADVWRERSAYLNTRAPLSQFRAAPFYVLPVAPTTPPAITDARLQRLDALPPAPQPDGSYRQAWRIRDATEAELEQWDAMNAPGPNYDLLYMGLMGSTVYQAYIGRAIASNSNAMPVAMAVLMDSLREARTREPIIPAITAALGMVLQAGQFTFTELAELDALLHAANLQDTYGLNP